MRHSTSENCDVRPLPSGRLTANEFAARFQSSFRVSWLIARGIVGNDELAEDVVQEAALIALGKLDQFEPGTNFSAWIGRVVRLTAMNHARKHRNRQTASLDPNLIEESAARFAPISNGDPRGPGPAGTTIPDSPLFDRQVEAALLGVSDMARACLLLRTVEGMKYTDIAGLLEIPEGTAMSHVHRARHFLRERLAEWWPADSKVNEADA